eukprot:c41282_g1_i1 orf=2-295(-)
MAQGGPMSTGLAPPGPHIEGMATDAGQLNGTLDVEMDDKMVCGQRWADVGPDSSALHTEERMLPPQSKYDQLKPQVNTQQEVPTKSIWQTLGQHCVAP